MVVQLTRAIEKEIVRRVRRRTTGQPFGWRVVEEISAEVCPPDGFSRQSLSANVRIREAYLRKSTAVRAGPAQSAPKSQNELERLKASVAELRDEIADRDEQLAHFAEVLLRMLRNAVDRGSMTREDLLKDLPPIHRLGAKSGQKAGNGKTANLRLPSGMA